jgi:hypothetical protein
MFKTRVEQEHLSEDGKTIPKMTIIEVPLTEDLIQDCYVYAPESAPSEIKRMLMEVFGESLDKIIIDNNPNHNNEQHLKDKLSNIIVSYKQDKR